MLWMHVLCFSSVFHVVRFTTGDSFRTLRRDLLLPSDGPSVPSQPDEMQKGLLSSALDFGDQVRMTECNPCIAPCISQTPRAPVWMMVRLMVSF